MSVLNPRNAAEATDSLASVTAAAVGLAALVYSVNVAETFVPEAASELLGYAQIAGGLLILVVFGPLLILLKARGGRPAGRPSSGGYLSALFRQAALTGFSLTVLFMIVLSVFDRTVLARFSAETAIDIVITFALAAFAISFFVLNRLGRLGDELGDEA